MGIKSRATKARANVTKGGGSKSKIDYKAIDKYKVETCGLETEEALPGRISGIVDVGTQAQEPAKIELSPSDDKDDLMKKYPSSWFETENGKEYRCYKRKPVNKFQLTIDFPSVQLDLGKFYGSDQGERPLRMVLNGEFTLAGGFRICGRPISISENNRELSDWSLSPKNTFYKMAKAGKLISGEEDADKLFPAHRLEELLGLAFQFSVKVGFNKKGYLEEKCSFLGPLARGQEVPELDPSLMYIISFDEENSAEALGQLRASLKNTMMLAEDYADPENKIKEQLEAIDPWRAEKYAEIAKEKNPDAEDEEDEGSKGFSAEGSNAGDEEEGVVFDGLELPTDDDEPEGETPEADTPEESDDTPSDDTSSDDNPFDE